MKIGVSAPGSSTHMIVNHLLGKAGLTSNDVSIIGVGTSGAAVAAIEKGEIDAIINSDPVMTKLETDNAITIIAETRTRKGTEDLFGGPYPEAGLYATADFIAKNPNTIQALTNAIVRAELWMQKASIEDIAANVPPEHMLGDRALYLESYIKMERSEEHTSELQSRELISYAVFCLKKKKKPSNIPSVSPFFNKKKKIDKTSL